MIWVNVFKNEISFKNIKKQVRIKRNIDSYVKGIDINKLDSWVVIGLELDIELESISTHSFKAFE